MSIIDPQEVYPVTRVEHHLLATCPCLDCATERQRREQQAPTNTLIKRLSPEAAYILGYIPRRTACGSVARQLMQASEGVR